MRIIKKRIRHLQRLDRARHRRSAIVVHGEGHLEDVSNAIQRFKRVVEVESENQIAVRALDRLYVQTEKWADLANILSKESEIGQTPDEILEFKRTADGEMPFKEHPIKTRKNPGNDAGKLDEEGAYCLHGIRFRNGCW